MAKQLLIYEQAQPVSKSKHNDLYVKTGGDYGFSRDLNSVPLTAVEFPSAAREYSIVFTGEGEALTPVAVFGVRNNENMYLSKDNKITADYIPAFLRRYPFIFAQNGKDNSLTLCIDESFAGCNRDGTGERLFDAGGEQTVYLKNVLNFLQTYQAQFKRTKAFCKRIAELDLLEPMTAQLRAADRPGITLTGFKTISRKKLKALSGEQLENLVRSDELELIYLHLQSLRNMTVFLEKFETETVSAEAS